MSYSKYHICSLRPGYFLFVMFQRPPVVSLLVLFNLNEAGFGHLCLRTTIILHTLTWFAICDALAPKGLNIKCYDYDTRGALDTKMTDQSSFFVSAVRYQNTILCLFSPPLIVMSTILWLFIQYRHRFHRVSKLTFWKHWSGVAGAGGFDLFLPEPTKGWTFAAHGIGDTRRSSCQNSCEL